MSTAATRKGTGHRQGSLSGLRHVREDRGLTQEQLGTLAGVSSRTIIRLEGGRFPSPATTVALAEILKTDVRDLMTPDGER
jgi:transcriptional regulator with XRE-family HTH domain